MACCDWLDFSCCLVTAWQRIRGLVGADGRPVTVLRRMGLTRPWFVSRVVRCPRSGWPPCHARPSPACPAPARSITSLSTPHVQPVSCSVLQARPDTAIGWQLLSSSAHTFGSGHTPSDPVLVRRCLGPPPSSRQRRRTRADALVARARSLSQRYAAAGVPASQLLLQLPATWAGIAAVGRLERDGVQCSVTHVYCLPQAAAAVRAGAGVLVINIAAINVWYDKNPGAIRDPRVRACARTCATCLCCVRRGSKQAVASLALTDRLCFPAPSLALWKEPGGSPHSAQQLLALARGSDRPPCWPNRLPFFAPAS
jgi:Transaldolase/Fructose-6-phosphate aldolase